MPLARQRRPARAAIARARGRRGSPATARRRRRTCARAGSRRRPASTTRSGGGAAPPSGQAHGQPRIVGPHGARADQHGVVRGAQLVRGLARAAGPVIQTGPPRRRAAGRRRCSRPASPPPSASPAAAARAPRPRRRGSPRGTRASRQPTSTRTPARRSRAMPLAVDDRVGIAAADDDARRPRRQHAAVHGPVRPTWQHGSSVTYSVAPRAARRAARAQRVHLGVRLAGAAVETFARRCVRRARPPRRRPGSAASCPGPVPASASARRMKRSSAARRLNACSPHVPACRASRPGS